MLFHAPCSNVNGGAWMEGAAVVPFEHGRIGYVMCLLTTYLRYCTCKIHLVPALLWDRPNLPTDVFGSNTHTARLPLANSEQSCKFPWLSQAAW